MGLPRAMADFLSSMWRLISLLNLLFFGVAFGVALTAGLVPPTLIYSGERAFVLPEPFYANMLLMILYLFALNLAVNTFLLVTLPGFVFFPFSALFLAYHAVTRGLLVYRLRALTYLFALPTIVLEGEAYVFAAAAGFVVGHSWLRPLAGFSRKEAFNEALKRECLHAYIFVILLLFVAAVVESATITFARL